MSLRHCIFALVLSLVVALTALSSMGNSMVAEWDAGSNTDAVATSKDTQPKDYLD